MSVRPNAIATVFSGTVILVGTGLITLGVLTGTGFTKNDNPDAPMALVASGAGVFVLGIITTLAFIQE